MRRACQRRTATLTMGSRSTPMLTRPASSAAITVEPEAMNVSSTTSPRLVTSQMAASSPLGTMRHLLEGCSEAIRAVLEELPRLGIDRVTACFRLPTPDGDVHVKWIQLGSETLSTGVFGGDKRG